MSAFVNSDGAPQLDASPRSHRGAKESGGDGASQEAMDLYLSSWKKKFNFAGTCSTTLRTLAHLSAVMIATALAEQ